MENNIDNLVSREDIQKAIEFLNQYGYDVTAKLMERMNEKDAELMKFVMETMKENGDKGKIKNTQMERGPIKNVTNQIRTATKGRLVEVRDDLKEMGENIKGFWKNIADKSKEAIREARQKALNLVGQGKTEVQRGASLTACKFAVTFNKAVISERGRMLQRNHMHRDRSMKRLENLEKIKRRTNNIKERGIIIRSAFAKNPEQYRKKALEDLSNARGYIDRLIAEEKAYLNRINDHGRRLENEINEAKKNIKDLEFEMENLLNPKEKETNIKNLENAKASKEPSLDDIINKIETQMKSEKVVNIDRGSRTNIEKPIAVNSGAR